MWNDFLWYLKSLNRLETGQEIGFEAVSGLTKGEVMKISEIWNNTRRLTSPTRQNFVRSDYGPLKYRLNLYKIETKLWYIMIYYGMLWYSYGKDSDISVRYYDIIL